MLWKGYHWASREGEQVIILQLRCDQWGREHARIAHMGHLGERHTIPPQHFQAYAEAAERARGYRLASLVAPPPGLRWA